MTHNQIDYQSLKETQRHNLEMESQGAKALSETARHNLAYEQETNRANLVGETLRASAQRESERSNAANESLKHEANVLNYTATLKGIAETSRHNKAYEQETSRANKRKEYIDYTHNKNVESETKRHNVQNENAQTFSNITSYETGRKSANANLINAEVNRWKAPSEKYKNVTGGINNLSNASYNQVKSLHEATGVFMDIIKLKGGRSK